MIGNHDYTEEICRCISFICSQIKKGWNYKETINQSIGSYGYSITLNAQRAIKRNMTKKVVIKCY